MRDALKQFHIRSCVGDALSRHGFAHDSPLRAQLEANATIASGDNSRVIMKSGNSLDVEIQNRLSSLRMDESLPTASRTVVKTDTDSLRKNFEDIAAGKVRVTD
jgi:hypothetical protein